MATWQAIVNGTTYNLSDRNPFDVVTVTGVGSAPVRRLSQRGPLQNGETDIGFRLDPRSINLVLAFAPATLALADAARDTLARIFGPRQSIPVQLRYTRDDAAVRQLDCYAVGMVDMPVTEEDRVGVLQRVAVQLVAPEPLWYDPSLNTSALSTSVSDIFSAGGMIAAGDIKNSVTNPAVGAVMGSTDFSVGAFTVYARTTLDNDADSTSQLFSLGTFDGTYTDTVQFYYQAAGINQQKLFAQVILSTAAMMGGGLHNYFFVYDGTTMRVYEDAVQKISAIHEWAFDVRLASSQWRGGTGYEWDQAVTHAAVYSKVLSTEERNAIIALTSVPTYSVGVVNDGSFDENPIIALTGPLVNPKVTNMATGEVLDFAGTTIAAGETYTIDLRYGKKTITDSLVANRIAALTSASDLASFHLVPGTNLLTMTATGVDSNSGARVYHYDRFLSL